MDRGWTDATCSGPERPRLGQQPYDRGRPIPNDRRSCFQCGKEGHISRNCPGENRAYDSARFVDRPPGGIFNRWPDPWAVSRPPTSFNRDYIYPRGENNRESSSIGRRAPFETREQGELYYRRDDRGRDNETSRGLDMAMPSNSSFRDRDSRSSRDSVRKSQDVLHQTNVVHRRDEQKSGKDDGKDVERDVKVEATSCSASNGVVTAEGKGETQRTAHLAKCSPRASHSEVDVARKDNTPFGRDASRGSSKDVDYQKSVSGSGIHGALTDKDGSRRSENGGKRGHKSSREEATRISDSSSSRSHSKLPLSALCQAVAEGVIDRKALHGNTERKATSGNAVSLSASVITAEGVGERRTSHGNSERKATKDNAVLTSSGIATEGVAERKALRENSERKSSKDNSERKSTKDNAVPRSVSGIAAEGVVEKKTVPDNSERKAAKDSAVLTSASGISAEDVAERKTTKDNAVLDPASGVAAECVAERRVTKDNGVLGSASGVSAEGVAEKKVTKDNAVLGSASGFAAEGGAERKVTKDIEILSSSSGVVAEGVAAERKAIKDNAVPSSSSEIIAEEIAAERKSIKDNAVPSSSSGIVADGFAEPKAPHGTAEKTTTKDTLVPSSASGIAAERAGERKASHENPGREMTKDHAAQSSASGSATEGALSVLPLSADKADSKTETLADKRELNSKAECLPQDLAGVEKRKIAERPKSCENETRPGTNCLKGKQIDRGQEVETEVAVSIDTKKPSVCDESLNKSGKGRRTSRWDTAKYVPKEEHPSDASQKSEKSQTRDSQKDEKSAVLTKFSASDSSHHGERNQRKVSVQDERHTVSNRDFTTANVTQHSEGSHRRDSIREERRGHSRRDTSSDAPQAFERRPLPSGRGAAEQDRDKRRPDSDMSYGQRGHGNDLSDGERDTSVPNYDSGPSSWFRRRGQFRDRNNEPDWRERDSDYDGRGRESESDRHGRGAERDFVRRHSDSGSLSPSRIRNGSRERDGTHDPYTSHRSREDSVERSSDRNGQVTYFERTGLKDGYRRRFETYGARNGLADSLDSEYCMGEDSADRRGWGAEERYSRRWESQYVARPQFRPGSYGVFGSSTYRSIVNARCSQQKSPSPMAISPPPSQVAEDQDPSLSASQPEDINGSTMESQSKGWLYNDRHGTLQGPVDLGQLKGMLDGQLLQSDHLVRRQGTNEWVTLEHAGSPANLAPSSPGNKQLSSLSFSGLSQTSPLPCPTNSEVRLNEKLVAPELADEDICPPGTEVLNDTYLDGDFGDLHIDERVEKLMQGFTYIPGKEGEIVYEALTSAAMRVKAAQGYETDQPNEESPRSHGGFANLGEQWKDGDFGSDVQGLDGSGNDQLVEKGDEKVEEVGMEVVSDAKPEVVSVPQPPPSIPCIKTSTVENKPELWTWPARGGDWKIYYLADSTQQTRSDASGGSEKGHQVPLAAKKTVMNGGTPLCESKHTHSRDPRKPPPESVRHSSGESFKLEVPKFGQGSLSKLGVSPEDHSTHSNQHRVTTPKGMHTGTPKVQGSTANASIAQSRSSTCGFGVGLKAAKPSRPTSTTPASNTGTGKSAVPVMHYQALSKGPRVLHQSSKHELLLVKKNATNINKYRVLPRGAGVGDGRSMSASDRITQQAGRAEATLRDRPSEHHREMDGEPSNAVLKKLFSKKDLASKESLNLNSGLWFYLDGMGRELGPFSYSEIQCFILEDKLFEGSSVYRKADDTWVPVTKPSVQVRINLPGESGNSTETGLGVPQVAVTPRPAVNLLPESSTLRKSNSDISKFSHTEPLPPAFTMPESCDLSSTKKEVPIQSSGGTMSNSSSFHNIHPQFLGFTRGKLHEHVMKCYKSAALPAALYECLEKWFQAKEKDKVSVVPSSGALGSPLSSVPTFTTEKCQGNGDGGLISPRYERQSQSHSTLTGRRRAQGTPSSSNDDAAKTAEIEAWSRATSTGQMGEEFSPSKRKAWALEDAKQHRRNTQKRRLLESEESDDDGRAGHSSHATRVVGSSLPRLVDDNPMITPETNLLQIPQFLEHGGQEKGWATLNPAILSKVLRRLRGDVKSLLNASASCKAWMIAGMNCKTELRIVDMSSLRGQKLDALVEAIPGFGAAKLRRLNVKGCTTVKPGSLAEVLRSCPSISAVEIDNYEPFTELIRSFPKVRFVMDTSEEQSSRELLIRKREEAHIKTKSLKLISETKDGVRESLNRESEDFEMHLVSDSASKVRSPTGHTCTLNTDLEINDSVQDSEFSHSTRVPNDGAKQFKVNNGSKRFDSANGYSKIAKRENEDGMSHVHLKRKVTTTSLHRKHEKIVRTRGKPLGSSHRAVVDKVSSGSIKTEYVSKTGCLSIVDGEKSLEKEIGVVLRAIMEADTNKVFQLANVSTDGRGGASNSGKSMDLVLIDKKLRNGAYASGKYGFQAFKEDVSLLIRNAFRNPKDTPIYSTAEKIFKLTHSHFASLASLIAGQSPIDIQTPSKSLGARSYGKLDKGRLKTPSVVQHRAGKKRKLWDDDGAQKGKYGFVRKGRQGDWSDVDSDSDSERDTRRLHKSRKERSWESDEGESSEDEDDGFMEEDEEETETEASDSDVPSESEGEDGIYEDDNYDSEDESQIGYLDWGARMTKAAMVPPVTRKYVVIEDYRIVADKERVQEKMRVELPKGFSQAAMEKDGDHYSHLDIPEIKEYQPRKRLGEEVMEQEVYGIDPFTHNLLLDTMPEEPLTESQKQQFIEERLLLALNKEGAKFTGTGRAPMELALVRVVERIAHEAELNKDWGLYDFAEQLLINMKARQRDKFVGYRKGLGVVCSKQQGLEKEEFVVEFFGEVYPPWRWYEKQDGIRSLQKKDKDPTPEFYNIYYERPKGDTAGYDLLVVDAMHKANFASRLCHSCRPNCEAKITAVNDTYIIGVYSLKPIQEGEELTFDYNSVTESKEEYNNAVCLCGSQGCRGSYLNLTGSGTFEEVIAKDHGLLERHRLLLDSCSPSMVTADEMNEMRQAGLGSCVLSGLPMWAVKYASRVVQFMNFEKTHLPAELLKDFELKRKQGIVEGSSEGDAEITTEGVYNQRLQNLTITLDKVRHILTEIFDKPSLAPPPIRKLDQREMVQRIWKKDNSVVNELLQCLGPHLPKEKLTELKEAVVRNSPHDSGTNLHHSLIWLRDAIRRQPATCKARHDAAADLLHLYAYTQHFFVLEEYRVVESNPVLITPLDLGSKHSLTGNRHWKKIYGKEYVWGQLINWFKQNVSDPGASLAKSSRGCLVLPDVSSCYSKSMQHDFRQGYGLKHREKMILHMEHKPQHRWPKSKVWTQFWSFKNERGLYGSPMLDSVLEDRPLKADMLRWLKHREIDFVGPWDEQ